MCHPSCRQKNSIKNLKLCEPRYYLLRIITSLVYCVYMRVVVKICAFSTLTLLVGQQEGIQSVKN